MARIFGSEGSVLQRRRGIALFLCGLLIGLVGCGTERAFPDRALSDVDGTRSQVDFEPLDPLPDNLGLAGPIVGVHEDRLVVAGGANFAEPDDPLLWSKPKLYHDRLFSLVPDQETSSGYRWQDEPGVRLPCPVGYSSVVSTPYGVLSIGGENAEGPLDRVFLIRQREGVGQGGASWEIIDRAIPDLPLPATAGGAALVGDYVYVVAGKVEQSDGTRGASRIVWRLKLDHLADVHDSTTNGPVGAWEPVATWPSGGPERMFPLVSSQHDGFGERLYVVGGRYVGEPSNLTPFMVTPGEKEASRLQFLRDVWVFDPGRFESKSFDPKTGEYGGPECWRRLADAPVPMSAGTIAPVGPSHLLVPTYASGDILQKQLKWTFRGRNKVEDFEHPGFPGQPFLYHTLTDTWVATGPSTAGQVTTPAVVWDDTIFLISGEVRPRVRTRKAWRITLPGQARDFGWLNMSVVVVYLVGIVFIGVYFTARNRTTDDYFRGGKSIPWWAAGCSIFATMLSSITYMAVPAKAFAQDWVYACGSAMILLVAPIAVYVALPFFRRIDATSAYEYLERRFNLLARLIGSASFSLFHVFRMGVVLALAALALASVTPLTPAQCVLVMGALSIIYCTLGGIEAVIWTDTIQTFVLFIGALACLLFAWYGSAPGSLDMAIASQKFHLVNWEFGSGSFMIMAIWVVVLGGLGQNVASYTADQAVVQRYMTTRTERQAARSIWLNGLLAVPAALIFFGMGTAFWMFYRTHPDRLDPTIATDRIMPLFISQELPIGLAGLVVAGIFAAAQSTVSTSMNSGATTIVTDFVKRLNLVRSDRASLWVARVLTLAMGVLGTWAGLLFVDPSIKSLFDQFIGILGMFLGVLAGLFALGATTRRANGVGSLIGALVAMAVMTSIVLAAQDQRVFGFSPRQMFDTIGWKLYLVNGYLYAAIGIVVCYGVGYLASTLLSSRVVDLAGLTLWDPVKESDEDPSQRENSG
ncbi:MAG: sodium:solute symporter [Mariniblastus sp.]|nr:sodium:solute symporter [Mariniblastus sp.]